MSEDAVTYESGDNIAVITLNQADKHNRLNNDLVEGLEAAWRRFALADDRVAVLASASAKAFTVGADLDNIPHDLFRGIPGIGVPLEKPVIGAVAGWCVGGGMVLTTMCDLLVATESAKFSYPEVKVGFSGGLIATLAARIPHKIAMELLLLGEPMDARRAYEVGYVNKVVLDGEHLEAAMEYARAIAGMAPLPTGMLKRFVGETVAKGPSEIAAIARVQLTEVNTSEDGKEGMAAFREKRPPVFKGR
ncbi:MAG: enoyl-CoA hydratase-related protein [Alphaproteobacteria bacterium]|jgi:enoyl-CoA hydratase/carnithine racemase|nr:enoyl-CoA hydratase-related protein [Alphaproteobacteria bacterium]